MRLSQSKAPELPSLGNSHSVEASRWKGLRKSEWWFKELEVGAGKMARPFRKLAALVVNPGSVYSTCVMAHNHL